MTHVRNFQNSTPNYKPCGTTAELQRRSSKIFLGQWPLSKRFLSSNARFIALTSIIDSLASPPPQGKILPIETKCLMYVNARSMVKWSYIGHLVSIGGIFP